MKIGQVEITEALIRCADGTQIALADIRQVSAPRMVIGVDPRLQPGEMRHVEGSGGVVSLLYAHGRSGPPTQKLVATQSFEEADAIAAAIQQARKALKAADQGEGRVAVGECQSCHRPLRVKKHAIRREMSLTCKCGHANKLIVPEELLR
jgi:hypothetical protein